MDNHVTVVRYAAQVHRTDMEHTDYRCATQNSDYRCPYARDYDSRDGYLHRKCCSSCGREGIHGRHCKRIPLALAVQFHTGSASSNSARPPALTEPNRQFHDEGFDNNADTQSLPSRMQEPLFRMPREHCWTKGSLIGFISWFTEAHDKVLSADAVDEWIALEQYLNNVHTKQENLEIHAYPANKCPAELRHISLHRGAFNSCDARRAGDMSILTGCRFEVMAELITFPCTPLALRTAVADIEWFQLKRFAFVCNYGIHRSVTFAWLLSAIYYTDALIGFHTSRAREDAELLLDFCKPDAAVGVAEAGGRL